MPDKKQSILIGTLVAGILSTSYLGFINFLCCAGIIAGAAVAVWHYGKTYGLSVPTKDALLMGIIAAVLGSILAGILNYVLALAGIRADQAITQLMLDNFGSNMPAEQYDELNRQMNQPVSLGLFFGLNFLFGLIGAVIFGAVGGAIGAAFTRKNAPPPTAPL